MYKINKNLPKQNKQKSAFIKQKWQNLKIKSAFIAASIACLVSSCNEDVSSITYEIAKDRTKIDSIKPEPKLLFKNQRVALLNNDLYDVIDSALYSLSDKTIAFLQTVDTSSSGLIGGTFGFINGTVYFKKPNESKWNNVSFKIGDSIEIGSKKYQVVSFELSNQKQKFTLMEFINLNPDSSNFLNPFELLEMGQNTVNLYYNIIRSGKVSLEKAQYKTNINDIFVGINEYHLVKRDQLPWKKLPFNSLFSGGNPALIKNFWGVPQEKRIKVSILKNGKTYDTTITASQQPTKYTFSVDGSKQEVQITIFNVDLNEFVKASNPRYYIKVEVDGTSFTKLLEMNQGFGISKDGSVLLLKIEK